MSTFALRQKLIDIADRDVGRMEDTRNRAAWIRKFWPATSYPEGYANREPYCAAACCYWVQTWGKSPEVLDALAMTPTVFERWRPKTAGAWEWENWARSKKVTVLPNKPGTVLHTGDFIIFTFHHIGLITTDNGASIYTIEANTDGPGTREGDGCYRKVRRWKEAKCFVRLLA